MLLSIGMIVKNEEKYLDRCLAAIKPFLDNIDSELIIADTGSTDNTVEIAKVQAQYRAAGGASEDRKGSLHAAVSSVVPEL